MVSSLGKRFVIIQAFINSPPIEGRLIVAILNKIGLWLKKATGQKQRYPAPVVIPRSEHGISRQDLSSNAVKVLYKLKDAGFSAYLVGGGVRDVLLGGEPKDFDVATDATPEEVRSLFRNCILIGRRFRLAHVRFHGEVIEVATFRSEVKPNKNNQKKEGMLLRDNQYGSMEEDAWRRDFTVNALYYNIADFSVVDYTGGMADLAAKQLRMIGNPEQRYREDPVRMLRAIRFAAKLNFSIHEETKEPLIPLSPLLEWVPPARLFEEFMKLFFYGQSKRTTDLLLEYQQFQYLFPATFNVLRHSAIAQKLLDLTLINTDQRINAGKSITPAFLVAALLWVPVQESTQQFRSEGEHSARAQQLAIEHVLKKQNQRLSIPKRFTMTTQEIWRMQHRLERRAPAHIFGLLESVRFRAAYDFLVLRGEAGEPVEEAGMWWTHFQDVDAQTKEAMVEELVQQQQSKQTGRKPRRRKR